MKAVVVDYGMGNLGSVRRALELLGADAVVASEPEQLQGADRVILPGVGSFSEGMERLRDGGWDAALAEATQLRQVPLLGICLGMQLLASHGDEGGRSAGLGLIPGRVRLLSELGCELRVPHVGWNSVLLLGAPTLFALIPDATDFYFVHSFAMVPEDDADLFATCDYGVQVAAVIGRGRVYGTQFHPEKSSKAGLQLLKNFLGPGPC